MCSNKEAVLTLTDCKNIIKKYLLDDEFEVIKYDVRTFSESVEGFLGEHLLITITYSRNTKEVEVKFFAKRFPYIHELHSRYAVSVRAFPNEIFTYQVLFKKFEEVSGLECQFAPILYYSKEDLLVFEDLTVKGFTTLQNINALTLDEVKIILKSLSKYHAASIRYQEITSCCLENEYGQNIPEPLFTKEDDFLGYAWLKARLSAINAIIDLCDATPQQFKAGLADLHEKCFDIMKPQGRFYNTLCHGDMWAKNVMVRYKNGIPIDCKLLDYQLQRFAPPAHDVLQIIYLTTGTEVRKRYLRELLLYYHDCLRSELQMGNMDINQILPYTQFELSVDYLLPQLKLQTAYFLSVEAANPEFLKKTVSNVEDLKCFEFIDGAPFTIDLFQTDESYGKFMKETLKELKDLINHKVILMEDCFRIVEDKFKTTNYELLNYSETPLTIDEVDGYHKIEVNIILGGEQRTLNLLAKNFPNCSSFPYCGNNAFFDEYFVVKRSIGVNDVSKCVPSYRLMKPNGTVVFEDPQFDDYRIGNPKTPFTFNELYVTVKSLAVYHAINVAAEGLTRENFKTKKDEKIKFVLPRLDLFPELFVDISRDVLIAKVKKAFEAYFQFEPSNEYRNIICHGNLQPCNLMLKYENDVPVDCVIVDLQQIRRCPPAYDLLCLLHLCTNRTTRTEHLQKLIDIYYKNFTNALKMYGIDADEMYPYKNFLESCEYVAPQVICRTALYYQCIMENEDPEEFLTDGSITNQTLLNDRKDLFIKNLCDQGEIYKNRVYESLLDLKEMCMKYF